MADASGDAGSELVREEFMVLFGLFKQEGQEGKVRILATEVATK